MPKKSKSKPKPKANATPCKMAGCENPSDCRGLCKRCYQACREIVAGGKSSWSDLEAAGVCDPIARMGRPTSMIRLQIMKKLGKETSE